MKGVRGIRRNRLGASRAATWREWLRVRAPAICAAALAFVLLSPLVAVADSRMRVAVFEMELIDTSLEGEMRGASQAESARLAMISRDLRQFFAAEPGFSLADIAPVSAADRKLHACNGCVPKLAARIGAELAVTGTVQKVSNLILNINIQVHDVTTGEIIQSASADIRGNTDETWRRGMKWLIENRLANFTNAASGADSD